MTRADALLLLSFEGILTLALCAALLWSAVYPLLEYARDRRRRR